MLMRMNTRTFLPGTLVVVLFGCDPPAKVPDKAKDGSPPPAVATAKAEAKRIAAGKNVVIEVLPDRPRRVRIDAQVCFREGPLELLLTRKDRKEHEAILAADIDARDVHKALLAAGAKAGSPVKYVPKFAPPAGSTIKVTFEYEKDGKTVTVPAREWVRNFKTKKDLHLDWVFAGSQLYPDPEGADKPPRYAANGGDVICVSNFDGAMLDLPVNSSQESGDLEWEAHTERIPPLQTKVVVVLEVVPDKK